MSQPGSVVEVLVQSRGSQLVGDHASGATTLLVQDPTPYDDAGGQVLADDVAYSYTTVTPIADTTDPAAVNGQLALTSGLTAPVLDLTPVDAWNGSQVLDDLILMVATGDEADNPIPVTLTATQRAFWEGQLGPCDPPVAVLLSDDLTLLEDAPGWTPKINGAQLVGLPDPAAVAVDPPDVSPAIISVTGSATALTVYTDPVLPTTLLDYYVNGVLVAADQRSTIVNLTSDGTNPLADDTDYTITAQAHNAATDADPTTLPAASAGVTQRLDPGMTTTQVVAILAAGTIITGSLLFGANGVLNSDGLTITQLDGRQTFMHADGSGNQFIGQAILDAVTILGLLAIQAGATLSSVFTLLSGVADPSSKPGVTAAGWDSIQQSGGGNYGLQPRGLYDNGAAWYYTDTFGTGNVNNINKTTGARTLVTSLPSGFNGLGGVVKVGTSWYVLGQDTNRSNNWYVYIFNTSWAKTGEWRVTDAPSDHSCAIGIDGAGALLIARRSTTTAFTINVWSTAGVESAAAGTYPTWSGAEITGGWKAAVDTATVRYVVSSKAHGIRVFNTSTAARVPGEEWSPAAGALGLGNDASNWFTLDLAKVWKYTNLIGTWDFAFDWADTDTGGTSGAGTGLGGANTARTRPSTIRTIAPTKRAKWTISLPSAPQDDGTADGSNTADLYAAPTGNTLVLQTTLADGIYSATYSTLATSGTAPSSTNGFAARLGAIGSIVSAALDASSNPLIAIKGDGSGRMGPLSWDTNGIGTQDNVMVTASGNAAPTSTTNVTVPGLSAAVTSPGTTAAWMVEICADVLIGATAGGNIVGLLIDGAEHASLIVSAGAPAGRFAATKRWRITGLSAGSHTFTVRTRSQGAYTTTVNQTHSTMTVERVA